MTLLTNFFRKNYFLVILKKVIKRLEKNTSVEAKKWATSKTKQTTEEFCRSIDTLLYNEVVDDIKSIEKYAQNKLSMLNVSLGGGGNYPLFYFLIRKINPNNVVETGVAAGWTSLVALRALKKNDKGRLYSSDFPYFRLKNPEKYIGYLAKDEKNAKDWYLDIRGDEVALPEIVKRLGNSNIDLFHYDSDKTYSGRANALKVLGSKINSKTVIIFDDIQDNLHFKDFVNSNYSTYCTLKFENKFIGIVGYDLLFSK